MQTSLVVSQQFLELLAIYHTLWLIPEPCNIFSYGICCAQLSPQLPYVFCKLYYSGPLDVLFQPNTYWKPIDSPSSYSILGLKSFLALCHSLTSMWMPWHAQTFFSSECMPRSLHSQFHHSACPLVPLGPDLTIQQCKHLVYQCAKCALFLPLVPLQPVRVSSHGP